MGVDYAEDGQFANGASRDEDALGVGAGVGRRQEQSGPVDQRAVVAGEALQFIAVAEGEAQPQVRFGVVVADEPPGSLAAELVLVSIITICLKNNWKWFHK